MSIPTEAIEAGAKTLSPHLWDGKLEPALLRLTGRFAFTPEQAAAAVLNKQNEALRDAEVIITAAAPFIQAAALREAGGSLLAEKCGGQYAPDHCETCRAAETINLIADQLEGKTK